MDDLARARLDLHRLDPAIFGQTRVGEVVDPPVRTVRVHLVGPVHLHDEVRLADVPLVLGREGLRGRHVGGIALRRAGVRPLHDGGDLVVGQRQVVLVVADADRAVDMPRRHLAIGHTRADRSRPRPHFVVGGERHRRGGAGVMARRALGLEDGRDVLREGRRRGHRRRRCGAGHRDRELRIRPAAVIAEVAGRLARTVVHDRLEDVLAGFAEGDRRGGLALLDRLRRARRRWPCPDRGTWTTSRSCRRSPRCSASSAARRLWRSG